MEEKTQILFHWVHPVKLPARQRFGAFTDQFSISWIFIYYFMIIIAPNLISSGKSDFRVQDPNQYLPREIPKDHLTWVKPLLENQAFIEQ